MGIVLAVSVYKKEGDKGMNRIDLFDVNRFHDEEGSFASWRFD